jgi:hypothetical protein
MKRKRRSVLIVISIFKVVMNIGVATSVGVDRVPSAVLNTAKVV